MRASHCAAMTHHCMCKALNGCQRPGGGCGWIAAGHARCHQSSADNRDQAPTKGESSQAGSPLQFHRSQLALSRRSSGWVLTCSFCSPGSPLLTSISQRNAPRSLPCRALIGSRWDFLSKSFRSYFIIISSFTYIDLVVIFSLRMVCGTSPRSLPPSQPASPTSSPPTSSGSRRSPRSDT